MSSRALRRLHEEPTVIRVGEQSEEGEEESGPLSTRGSKPRNLFAMLNEDHESSDAGDEDESGTPVASSHVTPVTKKKKKKKGKKKNSKPNQSPDEDVDAAIHEVNQMLGQVKVLSSPAVAMAAVYKSILCVDRRLLNANSEMRRIFGSRVVRGEERAPKSHKRTHLRTTALATPRDTWPKMDKPGLSMRMAQSKDGCQYFVFEHSSEYQKVQFKFWEATDTFDPNAIAAVLHAHPYHNDSLLQLSEVCKMSEDVQMAAELVERALYCFECSFHTLFNITQGNCRLSYSLAENRPFFIALFRHLNYVGRRGCHRTALEFCKLLLSLDPDGDPLCVLLMIDYHALRAEQYTFLTDLHTQWEPNRNLSQLPNFAFSIPLAQFHCRSPSLESETTVSECDRGLQEALIMFPSLLIPLLDKCGVTLDPNIMKHYFFSTADMGREPKSLQVLLQLYIERGHSLWKEPEVLTWLEANSRQVVARVNSGDPLVTQCTDKRKRRFVGTPRNIHRHVVMSDFDRVAAALPRDHGESAILSYDPLPPTDSVSAYTRPPRRLLPAGAEDENPFMLFLRSMLPTFNTQMPPNPPAGGMAGHRLVPEAAVEDMGGAQGGMEGNPGRPLDLQATVQSLIRTLQDVVQYVPQEPEEEGDWSSDSN
ncbi:ribosome quality control complex subunit TCF25-like [Halichondria panicea]|uniref:ribosome quality control complex subunit TCF25-like n=1 Tax=Halichondria panicea TaxID=6063 RepID=UPI00312B4D7F